MENEDATAEVIAYGRQLVRFLKGYDALKAKAGWFERGLLWLLRITYRQRLRAFVNMLPPEVSNQIFDERSGRNSEET